MWNYEEIGHNMALKMLLVDGVREPTLSQIQENPDENAKFTPAWKLHSDPHPGIPQHFLNVSRNDLQLASLPFSWVNREVHYKLIIKLDKMNPKLPSFQRLTNGTIILTGHKISDDINQNIEIFLHIQDKFIPCYYTQKPEDIIIDSSTPAGSPVRCYYLVIEDAIIEATFLTSRGKVIRRCEYKEMWFHGSTSYQELCNAVKIEE